MAMYSDLEESRLPSSNSPTRFSSTPCTLDAALNEAIGPWGHWQFRVSILASLLKFPIAWFQLGIVFLAPATEFWCRRPPQGEISVLNNVSVTEWKHLIWVNGSRKHNHQSLVHGSCFMHDPRTPLGTRPVPCMWGYEFNTTVFHSSIITEWEMVCGKENMIDIAQAVLMFGILLGTLILGIASDHFGRKPVLIICLAVQSVAGICSALVRTYLLFLLTRFVMAFANAGTMVCSFVICMEIVGGKWRTTVPILYQIPYGVGNSLMAIIAYFIRDWRHLQLVLSSLSAFYLIYWKYMPESPRWLLATGQKEKAIQLLEKIAAENGKPVEEVRSVLNCTNSNLFLKYPKPNPKLLFETKGLRRKTLLLCLHWLLAGISFYGFSQYMGQITNHLYIMIAIGGLISLPGTLFCCYIVRKFGRREAIAGAHIFTAACYIGILVVPQGTFYADWPRVTFAALGVVGFSISMPALYLYTGEIFPTVLRNAGIGAVMMCSRTGSMLAPFVTSLSNFTTWLPLFVLCCCVIFEALLIIPLPETKDLALPDTISDAESFIGNNNDDPQKEEH